MGRTWTGARAKGRRTEPEPREMDNHRRFFWIYMGFPPRAIGTNSSSSFGYNISQGGREKDVMVGKSRLGSIGVCSLFFLSLLSAAAEACNVRNPGEHDDSTRGGCKYHDGHDDHDAPRRGKGTFLNIKTSLHSQTPPSGTRGIQPHDTPNLSR